MDRLCENGCGKIATYYATSSKRWVCTKNQMQCPAIKKRAKKARECNNEIRNSGHICEYGCGKEAKYYFKNSKKWCCSKYVTQCESRKLNLSEEEILQRKYETREKQKRYLKEKKKEPEFIERRNRKARERYHANKEYRDKVKARRKERYKENPEKELAKIREYQKNNPEFINKNIISIRKFSNSSAKYDRDAPKIEWFEEVRRDPNDEKLLNVKCKQCGKWFIPTYIQVFSRMNTVLNGTGESHFYDTEECKQKCSVYNTRSTAEARRFLNGDSELWYTQAELAIWGKVVLERENYICEYCGNQAVHAHHEKAKKLEPFFALDPDNGIACCAECHYKYGHPIHTFCSTGMLAAKVCS